MTIMYVCMLALQKGEPLLLRAAGASSLSKAEK